MIACTVRFCVSFFSFYLSWLGKRVYEQSLLVHAFLILFSLFIYFILLGTRVRAIVRASLMFLLFLQV